MDIAIVGIGIHPFGRHDGVSEIDMGVYAARQALRDAGVAWEDLQFAFGGSLSFALGGGAVVLALAIDFALPLTTRKA